MKNTSNGKLNTRYGFTMAELIVVITILVILSALGFSAYSDNLSSARDTQRKADISELQSALNSYKQNRGSYATPGDAFDITYGTTEVVAKQGLLNKNVKLPTLNNLPKDPKADRFYTYSTTKNKQEFQIAATLENGGTPIALLKGDYKTVSKNILPTIVVASSSKIDINIAGNKDKFIFNGQGQNLPYTINGGGIQALGTDITSETSSSDFWQNSDFRTCLEIKEGGKILLEATRVEYQILDDTTGTMSGTTCSGSTQF